MTSDPVDRVQPTAPVRRRAAVGVSAAALILIAACSSGGPSAVQGSAGTVSAPRQALLAAATQAQQVTSATETLTVRDNTSGSTTTGTVQIRLKPSLLASESLNVTAAGTRTRIKMIFTSTTIYLNEGSLTSELGKPWIKMDLSALSALTGTSGTSLANLFRSLESNNFTSQAQLFTAAMNTRVVGTQTVDGVTTTEYTGSLTAAAALKALPASFRQVLAPELQALGNSPISFREWVDGQHHLRKMTEAETVDGDTVNTAINVTTINQPVHIRLPRASQTFTLQGSGSASENSFNGNLGAKVVPAPSGFALSQDPSEHSGPMKAAGFNTYMGAGGMAASLHFVRGYDTFYDDPDGDIIRVTLFQFATQDDAALFQDGWATGDPANTVNTRADPAIPGAEDFDSTVVQQESADHGVIAVKGNVAFVIDDVTSSTARVPAVETMARQQYAAL